MDIAVGDWTTTGGGGFWNNTDAFFGIATAEFPPNGAATNVQI